MRLPLDILGFGPRTVEDWVVRLSQGSLSERDGRALSLWLARDPQRLEKLETALKIWNLASGLKKSSSAQTMLDEALAQYAAGRQSSETATANDNGLQPAMGTSVSRRAFIQTGGAFGAVAAASAALFYFRSTALNFSTRKGEVRTVVLSDGSRVTMNTASQIEAKFDDSQRFVHLSEGEALFEVTKDPARPFVVESRGLQVKAVGTEFSVRNARQGPLVVAVQEGVVEMSDRENSFAPMRLHANMKATRPGASGLIQTSAIAPDDGNSELAWRDGKIVFRGQTLREAALEFNRYSDTSIVFENDSIANRTIAGYFSATDVQGFARTVGLSLNLKVEIAGDRVMLSAPRQAGETT